MATMLKGTDRRPPEYSYSHGVGIKPSPGLQGHP
jgi:hypothetical protein